MKALLDRRNIRVDLQYEGTHYVGWQSQASGRAIQDYLAHAIEQVVQQKIVLWSTSRTDAGVHARQQVASFFLDNNAIACRSICAGVNRVLPSDIRLLRVRDVNESFKPRDSVAKTYRYYLLLSEVNRVFYDRWSWFYPRQLDVVSLQEASQTFVGLHDFTSFRTGVATTQSSQREIIAIDWHWGAPNLIYVELTGRGFLRHMVRNIVGALMAYAQGRVTRGNIEQELRSPTRFKMGATAPAKGLFLWKVHFKALAVAKSSKALIKKPLTNGAHYVK